MPLEVVQAVPLPNKRPHLDQAIHLLLSEDHPYKLEYTIQRPSNGQLRRIISRARRRCATSRGAPEPG